MEGKLKSLDKGCLFETFRFLVLVVRKREDGQVPGKGDEIPPLGIGNGQENIGRWLPGVLVWNLFESSQKEPGQFRLAI